MRKKLFAVIMSAMMMITFMPTMAFADSVTFTATGYTDNYAKVTGYLGSDKADTLILDTTRTWETTTGMVKAAPDISGYSGMTLATGNALNAVYYYDLDFVKQTQVTYTTCSQDTFEGLFSVVNAYSSKAAIELKNFKISQPTYTIAEGSTAGTPVNLSNTCLTNYKTYIDMPVEYASGVYTEQKFEKLPIDIIAESDASADATHPDVIGSLGTKDFTVSALKAKAEQVKYYLDKVKAANEVTSNATLTYDGAEHTLVTNTVPGATVSYKLYNSKTGKYEAVEKVSFKDYGVYRYEATAKVGTGTNETTAKKTLILNVNKAAVKFGFVANPKIYTGVAYKPLDFFKVTASDNATSEAGKAEEKAIAAHLEGLTALFNARYEVVEKKVNDTQVKFVIQEKESYTDMSDAEKAAATKLVTEKYPEYVNFTTNFNTCEAETAALTATDVTGNELVACNQTKTLHIKKAKALKTKKTFKMANDYVKIGQASYFKKSGNSKIVIAKNGKVTVKKGLKKGTYKVKIKVVAPNSPLQLSDSKTLTVKVVK